MSLFGYLNLWNPTLINANEAQEAVNCRVDRGMIEFNSWSIDETINRQKKDLAGRTIFIDTDSTPFGSFPSNGYLRRILDDGSKDTVGTPAPSYLTGWNPGTGAGNTPRLRPLAYGSQPYPVGTYSYVITLYDPVTGDEGLAYTFTVAIGTNEVLEVSAFPAGSTDFAYKTSMEWRFYRMPLGGSEYLRVPSLIDGAGTETTSFPANSALTGPYRDTTADASLGAAIDNISNWVPDVFIDQNLLDIFEIHNGKFFFKQTIKPSSGPGNIDGIGGSHVVFFSKNGKFGEILSTNFFAFNSSVEAMLSLNESLTFLSHQEINILYGNDENDFVLKKIDSITRGNAGNFSAAVVGNMIVFLGADLNDDHRGDGIFVMAGNEVVRVSKKIESLFPIDVYDLGTGNPQAFGCGSTEDRFFVLRYSKNGANGYLVFDLKSRGFLQGDSGTTFRYRTKEFTTPPKAGYLRRCFVEGEGDFSVEIYMDGTKATDVSFSTTTRDRIWFTVRPYRSDLFSFRFVGQQNAKIYAYGVVDPPVKVGSA